MTTSLATATSLAAATSLTTTFIFYKNIHIG
jgi:hypothetical protein